MSASSNLKGILFMVLATAGFIINDTFLKFVMAGLPPYEALFLRSVAGVIWGVPLLALTGQLKAAHLVLERRVLTRNLGELVAVYGYVLALAYAPIADVTALSQLAPMLVSLGAVVFFGARLVKAELVLVAVGFIGAVLVAQPGGSGFSVFALLGLWNAAASAGRDLAGRRIDPSVPGLVVALGASMIVVVGAGAATLIFEHWTTPSPTQLLLIAGSGLFLTAGHFFIFMAFRTGEVGAVAPFQYAGTIWALIAGLVVFGALPNGLALAGIGLILLSGVAVVVLQRRAVVPPVA